MTFRIPAAFAGLALLASPAFAQVMAPADYVAIAGASDLYERQSSELVLQSTQDPTIRQFAQMMIDHHSQSTKDVTAAAKQAKVAAPPPKLMPTQAEMIAQLRAEKGPSRDKAYVAQQKAAHNQALEVQKAYAADGTAAPLRAAATKIVPVVQQHIQMLMKM